MATFSPGSAQLAALGKRLKQAGARDLRLELIRGLKAGAAPIVPAVKQAARDQLPKSGGLNEQVASQKVTVSVRLAGKTAGVRLQTTAPDTAQTDSGFVRHPIYGRRGKGQWRTQSIPRARGWWSQTIPKKAPEVTAALTAAQTRVGAKVQSGPIMTGL